MPVRVRAPRSQLILALLLAGVVVVIGGLASQRKIRSFQPIGFEARVEGGRWIVDQVASSASALQSGDQILLVNGQGYAQLDNLSEALRRKPASDLVVLRGDQIVELDYALPALEIDYPYLILALIGLGYLLIGFYTLLRDPHRPALLFYLWCLTSAVFYLVSPQPPFDALGKSSYLLDELARIFLAPLTLHLFFVFPTPLARRGKARRAIPFFYLPAAFLLALQTDFVLFNGRHLLGGDKAATLQLLDRLELFHIVILSLVAAAVLGWRLRHSQGREPYRQSLWIAVGTAAGYLPFLGLYLLPLSLGFRVPWTLTSAAVLPLGLVPVTFAYAILRYKLWDIGGIVRNTLSLSLTVLIGVFGFALANLTVSRLVPAEMQIGRSLLTFLSGLVIAGLLVPTRRGISGSIERLQYRRSFSKRRALLEFGRELLNERNLDQLAGALAHRLEATLDLRRTNLFLAHGHSLLPLRSEPALPDLVPFDSFPEEFWESDVENLSGVEFPSGSSIAQRLYAAGYRYAFPLRVRTASIGFVVTGYRDDDLPLSSDDLDLIRNLLNQAALAIENAQLLRQVQLQLEEVLRLQAFNQGIIESSPAGIAVLGSDHRVRSANLAFAALAGKDRRALTGKHLRDLLPIEPIPRRDEGLREVSYTDDDGEVRYLQVSVAPLRQPDSEANIVLVVQDISRRVEMERELKEKDRLASLGMLAAGVAHEVNTPITGISSYAQMLLAETPEDDPRFALLKKVEKQTFRAAQIVNNLLEFARNRRPEQRPVAMGAMLSETLELLQERIAEHRIRLLWEPPGRDVSVIGNQGELMQVFTNLAMNAVDAMGSEGGTLQVSMAVDEHWVWVTVEDSGPGISPRELDKIFQPFFSSKLGSGGTGLGLAITYNIVRRHGGNIRVISHPGEGSRFVVELPRRADSAAERSG
jgi:two-component system, NtrC family, sensor kinase